ncbi:MAG TPA: FAD-dependent oxidoreductase [Kofleriaceae bacterium]|nr:FAD-dependent oxidoreductase [Kofleriaceae bacterium]
MATARTARVVSARSTGGGTRILELCADEPLGFIGGQYLIIDSGVVLPSGKAAKRAYSILSSDADQRRLQIAVKRIPGGPVSGFLHGVEPGQAIAFSGPWGKLFPREGATGATVVVATDTGISAALGLVQAARFRALLPDTALVWLQAPGDDFLPAAMVRAQIPASCGEVRFAALPPIGHPERVPHARAVLAELLARRRIAQAFSSGDGAVNYALLDDLLAAGIAASRDSVESFFNMPKKSA